MKLEQVSVPREPRSTTRLARQPQHNTSSIALPLRSSLHRRDYTILIRAESIDPSQDSSQFTNVSSDRILPVLPHRSRNPEVCISACKPPHQHMKPPGFCTAAPPPMPTKMLDISSFERIRKPQVFIDWSCCADAWDLIFYKH
jgi:hypothetical protein